MISTVVSTVVSGIDFSTVVSSVVYFGVVSSRSFIGWHAASTAIHLSE
jgi:hypothetical protein